MRCLKCGSDNSTGMKFCGECAAPLIATCPKCGSENPPLRKFCGQCATPLVEAVGTAAAGPRAADHRRATDARTGRDARPREPVPPSERGELPEGERKTITALFADIKGSMELIEDLDPEEARAIIDPALQLMMDAVHHYGGHVAQSTGDGIFALFGAPIAHEDHAQRALYAALRMQQELKRYGDDLKREGQPPVQIRIGMNTGEVVVRSVQKDEAHADYLPVGHSTGLAERMQSIASSGSIMVTEHTHQLTEGYFQFRALGPTKVKGLSGPIEVY